MNKKKLAILASLLFFIIYKAFQVHGFHQACRYNIEQKNPLLIEMLQHFEADRFGRRPVQARFLEGRCKGLTATLYLDAESGELPDVGDRLEATLVLYPVFDFLNPASRKKQWALYQYGNLGTGRLIEWVFISSGPPPVRTDKIIPALKSSFSQLPESGNWLLPLLLGQGLSPSSRQQLADLGLIHLFVVSGLHIATIASVSFSVLMAVFQVLIGSTRRELRAVTATLSFSIGAGIAWISGMGLPAQRACIFVGVWWVSQVALVRLSRWQAWWYAVLICLMVSPFALFSIGAWLSFVACGMLMFVIMSEKKLKGIFMMQWRILLLLSPLLLIWGNIITPVSFPLNLMMIPVVTLVVLPFTLLFSGSLALLGKEPPSWVMGLENLATAITDITNWLHHKAVMASVPYLAGGEIAFPLICLLGIAVVRTHAFYLIALMFALVLSVAQPWLNQLKWVELHAFDVGQGSSILLRWGDTNLLYDAGTDYAARKAVLPMLRYLGLQKLDYLIVSHEDEDHAGGFPWLQQFIQVDQVIVGGNGLKTGVGEPCETDSIQIEQARLSFFQFHQGSSNEKSCILYFEHPDGNVLLTGDIGKDVEKKFIQLGTEVDPDVLLIPHHGSATSSSAELLTASSPKLSIVQAGRNSRFNHPHPEVINRYKRGNIPIYSTKESGYGYFELRGRDIYQHSPSWWAL